MKLLATVPKLFRLECTLGDQIRKGYRAPSESNTGEAKSG